MLVIENCNSLSDLRQKLIDGEEVRTAKQEPYKVSEYDKDHIWYRGVQYISLRRFLEVKAEADKESCEDVIRREDALQALCKAVHKNDDTIPCSNQRESCLWSKTKVQDYAREIWKIPSVTPQPKMGRWIYGEDNSGTGRDGWYCNQCGHFEFWDYSSDLKSAELNLPNLCPNCKAKMQEVEN